LEREKRLDGMWTFVYPLVGKVKIPFEVQIGGGVEDTVVRLASVSDYSHLLIVVASEGDQRIISSMINRFGIPKERMIYFTPEEVLTIRKALEKVEILREKLMAA
jgi:hypothetical protein